MISSPTSLPFETIVLIYNPNSTGGAPEAAEELVAELSKRLPDLKIVSQATEHAGHAIDIAREASHTHSSPLLISISGDGGYHEVVNGAMQAAETPLCAVYPAGNANDHRRTTRRSDLVDAIVSGIVTRLDLLSMTVDDATPRYAHSYIGLGITPAVAVELNKHTLNRLREMMIVIRTYWRHQPFELKLDSGRTKRFNSLVFSNINQMAKVLTLSEDGTPDDGVFEVVTWPAESKLRLLYMAAKAAVLHLGKQPRAKQYGFTPLSDMPIQLDGEVMELKEGAHVDVKIAPQALRTIR